MIIKIHKLGIIIVRTFVIFMFVRRIRLTHSSYIWPLLDIIVHKKETKISIKTALAMQRAKIPPRTPITFVKQAPHTLQPGRVQSCIS